MTAVLTVLTALSWVPSPNHTPDRPQKADRPSEATDTIKCPLTGEQIASYCCPVKK